MPFLLLVIAFLFSIDIEASLQDYEKAFEIQSGIFSNLDVDHPRLLILFSGTPGMGKTTLSLFLEDELQAVRLGADDTRGILRKQYDAMSSGESNNYNDTEIGLEEYLYFCLSKLDEESSNHLVILDRSIDGIEEETLTMADNLKYDTYIIRLECQKSTVIERLCHREEDPSLHLFRLNKWFNEYDQFPMELVDYSLDVESQWEELDLDGLVDAIHDKIATVPATDKDLPRTPPENVGALYSCLADLIPVLEKHNVAYWAFCGTALGMVRHGGMIPWDDDIDLAIYASDIDKLIAAQEDLNETGLSLYQANGYYKILKIGGTPIAKEDEPDAFYPWTYPFIDLFPLSECDGIVHYSNERLRKGLPKEYFTADQLQPPLPYADFGPLKLPLPHRSEEHLNRIYGLDWPTIAYAQLIHRLEKKIKKVKVRLEDYSPAEYIMK